MSPKRRSRGDGGLFQRADGMWIGRVDVPSLDGKRRRKEVSSKSFAEAAKKLRALRKEIDDGRLATTPNTTVEKWLGHWLETIHRTEVRPTTYLHYEQAIRLYINPRIGAKRLDRLTAEDVRAMIHDLQETSTRNAQKAYQALSRALADAVREGLLTRNVSDAVHKPKHTAEQREAFSLEVARHILTTAEQSCDEMWLARWVLAFFTGARQAELLGLTWDRVDLTPGSSSVLISWQLQRVRNAPPGFEMVPCEGKLFWTRPKSKAGWRKVPLPEAVRLLLGQLKISDYNPHQLVFHQGGHPITPEHDRAQWRLLLEAANVPYVPLHSVRNTAATLMHAGGIDEQTRMKLLGHSSLLAHRGYVDVIDAQERLAVAALTPLLDRTI